MPRKTQGDNAAVPAKASKSSTDYMREMRLRLKEAGLVKRNSGSGPRTSMPCVALKKP